MTSSPVESQSAASGPAGKKYWSTSRFWTLVLFVFAAQVLFVFWLGARHLPAPTKASAGPEIRLSSSQTNELFALSDPTMFALPHNENFSGAAWLRWPSLNFHPADWRESPRPLQLDIASLGTTFSHFMATNAVHSADFAFPLVPEPYTPEATVLHPIVKPSTLRVEGEIGGRQLLTPIALPLQTNSDLLANTELQVVVNSEGNVLSSVILRGSGNTDTDLFALNQAKHARFEALKSDSSRDSLTVGKMIFEWQTVPAATNGVPLTTSP